MVEDKYVLDLGSGTLRKHFHVEEENTVRADVRRGRFINVVCDGHKLPFKRKVFHKSYAIHILEHVQNPVKVIKELIRVTRKYVEMEVPHRLSSNARNGKNGHIWSFRVTWFRKVLKNYACHDKILYYFPRFIYIHVWMYL